MPVGVAEKGLVGTAEAEEDGRRRHVAGEGERR